MNKKVIVASKDIRSKLTKNIISDLNLATNSASLESAPVLERLGTVDKEKEMHVKNRGPVYARKDVIDAVQKKGSLQQGGVEVKEAPWCQDFVFSESEGYQGREEFIGYQFLLELSMAKKSLDVRIKYSGKALR